MDTESRAVRSLSPACRRTLSADVAKVCRGLRRAGYIAKGVRSVVRPGKAGVFSRSQSCYGKSQEPYSSGWQGDGKPRSLKPIDSVTERVTASCQAVTKVNAEVAPKVTKPRRPSLQPEGEDSMGTRKLADTGSPLRRGGSDGMIARTHHATGEALAAPVEKSPEQGRSYNRNNGKGAEGGRVADGPVVAMMRGNARVSEEALLLSLLFQHR